MLRALIPADDSIEYLFPHGDHVKNDEKAGKKGWGGRDSLPKAKKATGWNCERNQVCGKNPGGPR